MNARVAEIAPTVAVCKICNTAKAKLTKPQLQALAEEVMKKLAEVGEKPVRKEGSGSWILLDYSVLVVHIQSVELRNYYMLDRLWNDCPKIELDIVKEEAAARG